MWWLTAIGLVLSLGVIAGFLIMLESSISTLEQKCEQRGVPAELKQILDTARITNRRVGRDAGSLEARLRHHVIRDVSALLTLHDLYPTPGEHVPLTSWSAFPATALMLAKHVRELPPNSLVLELGSGATTLWMALASQRRGGDVRIVSLEASADFAEVTRTAVRRNDVEDLVEVRVGNLESVTTERGEQEWYAKETWQSLTDVALLFVDGPPGSTGPHARYPAVEMLASRLARGAIVVLDDIDRDDEQGALQHWLAIEREGNHAVVIEQRENAVALRLP
jgi:predicted O-methyltransferase YrrM